MGWAQPILFDQ